MRSDFPRSGRLRSPQQATPPTAHPHPRSGSRPRRGRRFLSARRTVTLVVSALLATALLDADSLVSSVSREQYGTARSIELALVRPFKAVSHWTGLDLPHRWIADLGPAPPSPLAPPLPPARPISLPISSAHRRLPGASPVTTVPATTVPSPLAPSASRPLRVWLAGDSLMGDIAQSFEESAAGDRSLAVTDSVQIGTGLARPDVYNWPAAVAHHMAADDPDVVVVIFGANDDQDMMVNGSRVALDTPAWQAEYARRASQVIDAVPPRHTLVWLELPPTARPKLNRTAAVIDRALAVAAAGHPNVELVDLRPAVAPGGAFAEYLPGPGGQALQVRDSDGVHLTPAGAKRVLPLIDAAIRRHWPGASG